MRDLDPKEIVRLLEQPTGDRRPLAALLEQEVETADLERALTMAPSGLTRQILCDILGRRCDGRAVPTLVRMLEDPESRVRSAAADAIAKIGDSRAGPGLLEALRRPGEAPPVFQMITLALGAIRYAPAIQSLIKLLAHDNGTVRGCAAWSLGNLGAREGQQALMDALSTEQDEYARKRMVEAIAVLGDTFGQ